MRDARAAEAEISRNGGPRSPLHGIPVGLKDIIDLAGHPTTCHSRLCLDRAPAAEDAAVVARLRRAGAVFPGKLATHVDYRWLVAALAAVSVGYLSGDWKGRRP